MKYSRILAVGGAYLDINCDHVPFGDDGIRPEVEVVGSSYETVPGGSAVNFVRLCAGLGLPSTFIGKVGSDAMGGMFAELLQKSGVQPALVVDKNVATNLGINVVNGDGKAIMAVAGTANQALTADEVQGRAAAVLAECSHFFIGGCFKLKALMPAFEDLAVQAKAAGTKIVLDHARLNAQVTETEKETVRRLAQRVDYYLPSTDEFLELWGFASVEDGLRAFAGMAPHVVVVVKDSSRGAVMIQDGEVIRVPAFAVEPIHTVGAGDSFNAGFITAESRASDLLQNVRFACATAALKISNPQPPTRAMVEAFLRQHS